MHQLAAPLPQWIPWIPRLRLHASGYAPYRLSDSGGIQAPGVRRIHMRERAWHRSVLAAGLAASLATVVLGLGSCSDDSADGGPSTTERRGAATLTTTTSTTAPSTTQPPASDA